MFTLVFTLLGNFVSMVSVAIVLRKDKLSKANLAPIHFRLTRDRKVRYIATGLAVQPHYWDKTNRIIKRGVPNAARLNALLAQRHAEVQTIALDEEAVHPGRVSAQKIKQLISGTNQVDFIRFAEEFVEGYRVAGQIGSYDLARAILSKLKGFTGSKPLLFSDVTPMFLARYERYLREHHKNKTNTIHTNLKLLRRVFRVAYERDVVDFAQNPFHKYKLRLEKTERPYLLEAEIQALEALDLPPRSPISCARDMFVWNCYAGGLRVSDLLLLKWTNFDGSHIHFFIRKTRQPHRIKLPRKALGILEQLKAQGITGRYLFGALPRYLDEQDPKAVDAAIACATARYNKQLKALAKLAGMQKLLSSHVSRHSFATLALRRGVSLDKLQYLLSHHSPTVTQLYAKMVNTALDEAMDLMD